jgi:hypothetical protein
MVTVNQNPTVTATAGHTVVCKGDPLVITASGGTSYKWFNQATTASITFTSNFTTLQTLTVMGTDANGCSSVASLQVQVNKCTSIAEGQIASVSISIYPNPNTGEFFVSSTTDVDLRLINELGQLVKSIRLSNENANKASLNGIAEGIYFIVGQDGNSAINQKIIVSR